MSLPGSRSLVDKLVLLSKLMFGAGLLALAGGWFFVSDLPPGAAILPELAQDPVQEQVSMPPFTADIGGRGYQVKPLYEYELWGLVVSMHQSEGWRDYAHRDWGDSLNVADLCVVWGEHNARSGLYQKLSFSSGQFTCYVESSDSATWEKFVGEELSNNHILVTDKAIRARVKNARIGDQIHFRGYLVNYQLPGGWRNTSTVRTDSGNGACEVVWVEEFDVLKKRPGLGPGLRWAGVLLMLGAVILFLLTALLPARFLFT